MKMKLMSQNFLLVFFLTITFLLVRTIKAQQNDKLFFIENKGQWHSDVLYLCRMGGLEAWITKYGMNYTFYKVEKDKNTEFARTKTGIPKDKFDHEYMENSILLGHRVLFELQNHNANVTREAKQQQEGYYNYFIGNNPSKHATYVGLYKEVIIKNIYDGIDIRYYFEKGNLRYDFIVQPYADASQIKFKLHGQDKVYAKDERKLCFTTHFGEVELADLKTYQNNNVIPSKFIKHNDVWTFALGEYDHSKPLVIDPLVYSTYIGGSGEDRGYDIAVDATGCAYITGWTQSSDYDVTAGAFRTAPVGTGDIFVTKLNPTGSTLVYSTYIGGNSTDWGIGIALDANQNAYITGDTWSGIFDITPCAYQSSHALGMSDGFVTILNSTGTALIYSTYLGGSGYDVLGDSGSGGHGIAVNGVGEIYTVRRTNNSAYPTTPGAFQVTFDGVEDVVVSKLDISSCLSNMYLTVKGFASKNSVVLDWKSEIQETLKEFAIEKWQNNTWKNIAQISPNTYHYQDKEGIYAGATCMYRVRATNKDGQSYYSNVETIAIPEQNQSFGLYPNPVQHSVFIENFTSNPQEYEIIDISGKVLQAYILPQGKNNIEITLPKGMYFVRERKQGKMEKLVVE